MGVRIPPPLPLLLSGRNEVNAVMEFVTRIREFIQEVLLEFRRVTWPNRQELVNSTVVVLALTVIVAFFLGGVDIGLSKLVQRILR
jgi:preprotein translocase subunit SecE